MGKEDVSIAPMGSSKRMETTKITWSLEELTELVNDKSSHVHLVNTRRHIALHPCQLDNLKQSLQDVLGGDINYYDDNLEGLFLSYKNPKLLSENAALLNESFSCHVDIEADFYVFKPKVDYVLKGIINKKAVNHLGVLVHKAFNVSIPKRDEDEEYWHGDQLDAGDEVTFTVELMDLKPGKGKLPFIRGKLVFSDDDISVAKKSKKHRFTDEELNFEGSNCDEENENEEISGIHGNKPKFSSTVNESNSSESEEERVECSVKGTSQNLQVDSDSDGADDTVTGDRIKSGGKTIKEASSDADLDGADDTVTGDRIKSGGKTIKEASSDDSDGEVEVFDESRRKELSKKSSEKNKNLQQSSEDSEEDPDISYQSKNIEKSLNSNEKNLIVNGKNSNKGKIQVPSSDDSDDDLPVFKMNKSIKAESPKKVQKTIKNTQQDSDDISSIFNKPIKKSSSPEKLSNELVEEVKRDSDDSDDKVPDFNKSKNIEKSSSSVESRKAVNDSRNNSNDVKFSSSDDSDNQVPFANKSSQKSSLKKKSQKFSKRISQNSPDSDDDFPVLNDSTKQESSKKLKRKKHSEIENSVNVDDSLKKIKKQSKKLRKVEMSESGDENSGKTTRVNGEDNSDDNDILNIPSTTEKIEIEKKSTYPGKTQKRKPAHNISSSDNSETENDREKPIKVKRELKNNISDDEKNNVNNKFIKNKINVTNDDDDSDDDFESFMLARKIEEENELETSKTAKSKEGSQSTDYQTISSSKKSVSLKKKSKEASKNGEVEGDSIQMLLHAEHIKPEKENKIGNIEDSDLDISKKVKKETKKSKKFKQSEDLQEEDINSETSVEIKEKKKKKSDVLRVQSDKIVNLQAEEDSDAEFDSSTADLRMKESESHELFPFVKKEKKGKREKDSKSEKSMKKSEGSEIREEESTTILSMSPPPPRFVKERKHKSSKIKQSSNDDNGELSDASSTKSRILVKKEESVFFANIKIKQEPYASDAESISSRKRKRKDSTKLSSERNYTFDNIRIKRESSVVKSESNVKIKKDRRDSVNDSSIKNEASASDLDDAPPKKKSKKKFSE